MSKPSGKPYDEIEADMTNWRPIETAPKDGSPVLIFEDGDIVVARYSPDWLPAHRWRGTYGDGDASWNPTHWMPLPAHPRS